jgi:Flp pilus assembly protein TadD
VAALLAAVALAYQPAWNGGFLWDDAAHVTRADLRSWRGLWRIWSEPGATQQYYPLLHSAFWLQHRLWGDAPAGYHLVNLALHAAAALLAGLALRRLSVPGAFLAAAVFALHPVHVESVAWITELKNTLSAVLYLGAAMAWLRFEEERRARAYLLALALFVLALCSKTVTATLPAALLLLHWWKRGRPGWRREVLPLLPFFALGAAAGSFTAWVERKLVGAEGAAFDLSPVERGLVAGRAAWFYLGKLVWPADLSFVYPRWSVSQAIWWQYLYPAAALAVLAILWSQRQRWPGPLAGTLFFLGTLFPALGFFDVYPFLFSFVADHFQYLASLGIIALAAAGAARLLERRRLWRRPAGDALCLAALAVLAALTWQRSHLFADRETLYRATIRSNPGCWMAYNNLAGSLIARGATEEALGLVQRALDLRPDYPEAHNNLGLVLASRGRWDEAIRHYRRALELDPAYPEAHNNLGFAIAAGGELDEAIAHYRWALEGDPGQAGVHYNLAMALLARGDDPQAAAHLRRALELQPDFLEAHNNLGILLARSGRLDEAIEQFRRALEIAPSSAEVRRNLDLALERRGGAEIRR